MNRSRTLVVAGLVAIVLAACGSSSASPSASQSASVAPSASAAESPGIGLPSFSAGVVAELEALIPDEIGGATMQKFSMRGDQFLTSGQEDPTTARFLEELGVSPNDVSIAFGFGFAPDFTSGAAMFVFRAEGATDSAWLADGLADEEPQAARMMATRPATTTVRGRFIDLVPRYRALWGGA